MQSSQFYHYDKIVKIIINLFMPTLEELKPFYLQDIFNRIYFSNITLNKQKYLNKY